MGLIYYVYLQLEELNITFVFNLKSSLTFICMHPRMCCWHPLIGGFSQDVINKVRTSDGRCAEFFLFSLFQVFFHFAFSSSNLPYSVFFQDTDIHFYQAIETR